MATNRKSTKKAGIAVDFSDTESQASLPEGDFLFEVDEVEQKTSENSGNDYLSITFKVAEGEFKGKKVWHNCSLQPQALFNLRGVLEALGFEVPQGVMELDPADMIGETCGGTVQLEVYEGKKRPRIVEFFSADELGEEEAPAKPAAKPAAKKAAEPAEEEPAAKPAAKKKAAKKEEPEEPTIEVGSKVTFTDDEGEELEGKVLSIDGDTATVKVGKEEWEISLDELTLA
ncbi:hypothetical protein [Caudoviricetes sp.]|nr:hypothetical protein [Caudoviricetes sp.]